MINERDVRAKIAAVLDSEISIVDFVRWIISNSWNMHQDSSPSAVSLVSEIHLLLAERDDLSLDNAAFLRELSVLNSNAVVSTPVDIDERLVNSRPYFANSERWLVPAIPLVAV
ncbi:MAG: hypothetical protein LAO18_19690 [Acidobacteriia bacterium]|nr:hypothetical protein [Terriglobia bacterium]